MRQPMDYQGTYPSKWAGYYFKETLGYTSGRHTGVDYNHGTDDLGDPIYAIASGKVVARINNGQVRGFGNAFIIETNGTPSGVSGSKLYHRYLHCNSIRVNVGDTVRQGQVVATVGTTGGVPAHLHLDTWTNRNGLGIHWKYHKDTQLASYVDPYILIKNNASWDAGNGEIMDTDKKVGDQYFTLRGSRGTANERKGWIGKSYSEFNATAIPEVNGRTANITNLTNAVATLSKERDSARKQVATLTAELLAERDKLKALEAENKTLTAEIEGARKAYAELKAGHEAQIKELEEVIDTTEKDMVKLAKELETCKNEAGDIADKSGWALIALGLKKLFERSK